MEGWEVVAFYFGDDFLRQVFRGYRQYLPLKNLPSPPSDMLIEINVNEITRAFFYGMVPYFTQRIPPSGISSSLAFQVFLFRCHSLDLFSPTFHNFL